MKYKRKTKLPFYPALRTNEQDAGLLVGRKVDKLLKDNDWDINTCEEYFEKQ
jgi:hypothetical protein